MNLYNLDIIPDFPNDISFHILSYLKTDELLFNFRRVSCSWNIACKGIIKFRKQDADGTYEKICVVLGDIFKEPKTLFPQLSKKETFLVFQINNQISSISKVEKTQQTKSSIQTYCYRFNTQRIAHWIQLYDHLEELHLGKKVSILANWVFKDLTIFRRTNIESIEGNFKLCRIMPFNVLSLRDRETILLDLLNDPQWNDSLCKIAVQFTELMITEKSSAGKWNGLTKIIEKLIKDRNFPKALDIVHLIKTNQRYTLFEEIIKEHIKELNLLETEALINFLFSQCEVFDKYSDLAFQKAKLSSLLLLSQAWIDQKNKDKVEQILSQVTQILNVVSNEQELKYQVALQYLQIGNLKQAAAFADSIKSMLLCVKQNKQSIYEAIFYKLIENDQLEEAERIAIYKPFDLNKKSEIYFFLFKTYLEKGMKEKAQLVSERIPLKNQRELAIRMIEEDTFVCEVFEEPTVFFDETKQRKRKLDDDIE